MVKLSDLRTREVINVLDGKKLGHIIDIELDIVRGRVLALLLPGSCKGWNVFSRREEVVVPWEKIVRIGQDVILVEIPDFTGPERKYKGRFLDEDDNF